MFVKGNGLPRIPDRGQKRKTVTDSAGLVDHLSLIWQTDTESLKSPIAACNSTVGGVIIAGTTHQTTNPHGPGALLGISDPLSTMWHHFSTASRHLEYHLLSLRALVQLCPLWTWCQLPAAWDHPTEDTQRLPSGLKWPVETLTAFYNCLCKIMHGLPDGQSGRAVVTKKYTWLSLLHEAHWDHLALFRCLQILSIYVWQRRLKSKIHWETFCLIYICSIYILYFFCEE